jgi:cytochrome P450
MKKTTSPFFNEKRKYPFVPRTISRKRLESSEYKNKIPKLVSPKQLLFKSWKNKAEVFKDIRDQHGPCSSFFIANELTITAFSPELTYEVLVGQQNKFIKGNGWNRIRKFAGDGLVTAEQPSHIKNRRMIQPNFNHKKILEDYTEVMVRKSTEKAAYLASTKNKLNLHDQMVSLVFDIVLESLFGIKEKKDSDSVRKNMEIAMDSVERTIAAGLDRYDFTPLPVFKKFRNASLDLHEFALSLIKERKENPVEKDDLLTFLINSEMTPQQISDEVLTIILAGFETTANTLSWVFSYLNQNDFIYEQVILESRRIMSSDNFLHEIDSSEILNGIVKETLRLNPSLWVLPRMAAVDVTIGDYFIPQGSNIIMSPFVTHRDENIYKNSDKFIPSRWDNDFEKTLPRGSYVPFSAGPRKCIGDQFATLEMKIIITIFSSMFKVKTIGGFPEAAARGTYRLAKPVKFKIENHVQD